MEKNQIKWLIIASLLVVFFILFTPITLFFNNSVIISMIEGVIIAFLIFLSILNINSFYELSEIDEIEKSKNLSSILLPFISFIFFAIIIFQGINYRIDLKFESEGILTKAQIVDGQQTIKQSLRRGSSTSFNIEVFFNDTIYKKDYKLTTEINEEIFNSLHKDQFVEIKYLKSEPTIFKLTLKN